MLQIKANREVFQTTKPCPKWIDLIDLVLFINLDKRKDRRSLIIKEFQELGIPCEKVVRISAVPSGFTGCTKSHINALSFAMIHDCKRVMICEDDFHVYSINFNEELNKAMKNQLITSTLMVAMTPIYLGPIIQDTNLRRVNQASGMCCYIVYKSYFEKLLSIFQEALVVNKPHDMLTQTKQNRDYWYGFFPPIAVQRPGFSDIENKNVDYSYLEVQGQMIQTKRK